jgi:glycosyltransferase involved in cell wall biosynthesis
LKITQVLLSDRIGGAETLAAALDNEWGLSGIQCETVYLDAADSRSRHPVARVARLRRRLKASRADVIVAHSALPAVYARICRPRGSIVYSVLHSAGDDFRDSKLNVAERILRVRTQAIIAVSATQARVYKAHFGESLPVHVVPNGIGRQFRGDVTRPAAPRLIVEVARAVPQKRPDVWIQAVAALIRDNPALRAEWWGPPSGDLAFDKEVRDLASARNLESLFRGPTDDPAEIYRRGDVLVHAATREAHSVGLLEAAAMGMPIVCSDKVAATMPSEIDVVSFRAGDHEDLAAQIRYVVENWQHRLNIARTQASGVATRYSAEACARRYLGIFESDAAGPAKSRMRTFVRISSPPKADR